MANDFRLSSLLTTLSMRGQLRRQPATRHLPTLHRRRRARHIAQAQETRSAAPTPPTLSSGAAAIDGGAVEICAGIGTFSAAVQHHGLRVVAASETDQTAAAVFSDLFPTTEVVGDAASADFDEACTGTRIRLVFGGPPCQPTAHNGKQLGLADKRAALTTDVPFALAKRFGAHIVLLENADRIATCNDGEVLLRADANAKAVGMTRVRSLDTSAPLGLERFDIATQGGPATRNRGCLHFEASWIESKVGPCWPLPTQTHDIVRINDIMLPTNDIPEAAFLAGELTMLPRKTDSEVRLASAPVQAATLTIGGTSAAIAAGSYVFIEHEDASLHTRVWTVIALNDTTSPTTLRLFDDRRDGVGYLHDVEITRVRRHLERAFPVWDTRGPASGFTRMSLPPLGSGKQLWLRDGRAVIPQPAELLRLLELNDTVSGVFARIHGADADAQAAACAGNGIGMRMADELAYRASLRLRQIDSYEQHQRYLRLRTTDDDSLEARLFESAQPYVAHATVTTFIVAVTVAPDGSLLVLAPTDGVQLPTATCISDRTASRRTLACERAKTKLRKLTGLSTVEAMLAHSDDDRIVVVAPVEYGATAHGGTPAASWVPLSAMANTLIYQPLAQAVTHISTYLRPACSLKDRGRRGARPLTPFLPGAVDPPPPSIMWNQ